MKFKDENGLHYNLPGGEVEANESWVEAVKRRAQEDPSVEIGAVPVAFMYEYTPRQNSYKYGTVPSLTIIFEYMLMPNEITKVSETANF